MEPFDITTNGIAIPNAPWWLPHSHVLLKGLYLAEDDAYITNQTATFNVQGAGTQNVTAQTQAGNQAIYKIQRMVKQGTVAIMLRGGAKHETSLPAQANRLTVHDLNYIISQIDALSQPMSLEEQQNFLASQNGHVEETLSTVK